MILSESFRRRIALGIESVPGSAATPDLVLGGAELVGQPELGLAPDGAGTPAGRVNPLMAIARGAAAVLAGELQGRRVSAGGVTRSIAEHLLRLAWDESGGGPGPYVTLAIADPAGSIRHRGARVDRFELLAHAGGRILWRLESRAIAEEPIATPTLSAAGPPRPFLARDMTVSVAGQPLAWSEARLLIEHGLAPSGAGANPPSAWVPTARRVELELLLDRPAAGWRADVAGGPVERAVTLTLLGRHEGSGPATFTRLIASLPRAVATEVRDIPLGADRRVLVRLAAWRPTGPDSELSMTWSTV